MNNKSSVATHSSRVYFHTRWRTFRNPMIASGMGLVAVVVLLAIISPWIVPNDPLLVNMADRLLSPSLEYPLGTDHLGRCLFSRLMDGARMTLGTTFVFITIVVSIGVTIGLFSGYVGGIVDSILMRVTDGLGAVPEFLLAVAVAGFLGPGLLNVMFAICCVKWISYARLVRGIILSEREKEYVLASIVAGSGTWTVIKRHLLRQIASPLAVVAALDVGKMILLISMLSYLGLGTQPPAPEWGAMLSDGRPYFQAAPELMIYPGLLILTVVLACNLLSDGLRDHLDVRNRT
ncbi:ABC transporter permease subunit [Paenibacillus sp. GSMTC-2017]|uniref:nickel transporter permease n=1 Tax=Paenibacillus sp. GSMTC-2017 TaxID=2794350 RepID=UPI0018D80128|nr:nickel transporter permease [Paenibacillus sp. GSMTC-2017]MBH5316430.1 ABC transporter permease subunit [Paenibacillus sp. GSMTC-2017]